MNTCPVVTCHGLFGYGAGALPIDYWGSGTKVPSPLKIYEASVGPVSSYHDRACEAIAQVIGLRVDYGEAHSKLHGHKRFGKNYSGKGFYPIWSDKHPIHLVGHSAGGNTTRMIQYLLATDHYKLKTNENWIKSISTISACTNGTPLANFLGDDKKTGIIKKDSIGMFLGYAVQALSLLTEKEGLWQYDWSLDQWGYAHDDNRPLKETVSKILELKVFDGIDNLAFDCGFTGAWKVNGLIPSYPNTYYFGYGTEQTTKGIFTDDHHPTLRMNPSIAPVALWMGHRDYEKEKYFEGDWGLGLLTNDNWRANDGCVPLVSQYYPFQNPKIKHNVAPRGISNRTSFEANTWYYEDLKDGMGISFDHFDIVCGGMVDPFIWGKQKEFYTKLWERLASL